MKRFSDNLPPKAGFQRVDPTTFLYLSSTQPCSIMQIRLRSPTTFLSPSSTQPCSITQLQLRSHHSRLCGTSQNSPISPGMRYILLVYVRAIASPSAPKTIRQYMESTKNQAIRTSIPANMDSKDTKSSHPKVAHHEVSADTDSTYSRLPDSKSGEPKHKRPGEDIMNSDDPSTAALRYVLLEMLPP